MKRFFLIFFLLIFYINVFSQNIVNKNIPLKGEWNFNPVKIWSVSNGGNDFFSKGAIAVGEKGLCYFIERKQFKTYIFDSDGKFLSSFGRNGEGPGEFKLAFKIFAPKDKIFVPDLGFMNRFSKDGKFEKKEIIPELGPFSTPLAFIDDKTILYLKEDDKHNENIYIYDMINKNSRKIFSYKSTSQKELPTGAFASNDNVIAYADKNSILLSRKNKYEIKEFHLNGKEKLSFSIKDREKIKISLKRKTFEAERQLSNGTTFATSSGFFKPTKEFLIKNMPNKIPSYFERIYKDINGYIYLFRNKWENNGEERKIDIFSPDGKYIYNGKLLLPDNTIIIGEPIFYKNYLYAFTENKEGERKLEKYKIELPYINKL